VTTSSAALLIPRLASLPPGSRDAVVDEYLGITPAAPSAPPGEHLVGYHPSGVASILRALVEVPIRSDDVLVDLGSGLGKVVLLAALLTGATCCGVELQPELVSRSRACAARLGLDARFEVGDARSAPLDHGTVFYLYAPFTGPVLSQVLDRLHAVAERREIVVCALGADLDRARWLARRELDAFWLAIYDSRVPGAARRRAGARSALPRAAEAIAYERGARSLT
jgi:hypothetical protein